MPRYLTQSYLEDLFGAERLERMTRGGPGTIDATQVESAMSAADDEVDTYLQGVIDLPIPADAVPRPLRLQAAKIAMWYLAGDNVTDGVQAQYDSAIKTLRRVQKDEGGLGLTTTGDTAERTPGVRQTDPPRRFFDQDTLDDYSGL